MGKEEFRMEKSLLYLDTLITGGPYNLNAYKSTTGSQFASSILNSSEF